MRAAFVLVLLTASTASAQVTPFTSHRKLSGSNGYAPIVFDVESRRIVSFRENMYRFPEPGVETRELAFDLYLGLRVNGQSGWMTEVALDEAGYEVGTGLIRTVQRVGGLRLTTTYTAPYGIDARAMLVVAELINDGPDVSDVALFSLHNFHVGGGTDGVNGERIVWTDGSYVETGPGGGALITRPITPASARTAGAMNPFSIVNSNGLFGSVNDSGLMRDAVCGLQFDVAGRGAFTAGSTASFAFVVAWAPDGDAAAMAARIDALPDSPGAVLQAERQGWQDWLQAGLVPTGSVDESQIALQSLAVLRMGQVREPGAPNGQILASLPPGMWDIAWLRDGLLAVRAYTATGHHDEAEAALDFYLRGPTSDYESYIGRPYRLSVARYFGNAREESDFNANGPNIELDGFGMFLEAAAEHVDAGRTAWFATNRQVINDGVADVLVAFSDAETGLVAADSSIWESHWDNGGRQRWVFTSGYAVIGLSRWADTLDAQAPGNPRSATYRAAAARIRAGMQAHLLTPSGALASSVEQLRVGDGRVADAQAVLVLSPDTFSATSAVGLATLDFMRERLFLSSTTGRGYKRNDDGDLYDEREWVVIDLGISRALRIAGRVSEADALLSWVTGQAAANYLLVPELFEQNDGRYFGEVPMIGFGAGAYLLALIERASVAPPPADAGVADAGVTDAERVDAGTIDATASDVASDGDASAPFDGADTHPDVDSTSDSGVSLVDAGPTLRQMERCACDHAGRSGTNPVVLVLLVTLLALRRRA